MHASVWDESQGLAVGMIRPGSDPDGDFIRANERVLEFSRLHALSPFPLVWVAVTTPNMPSPSPRIRKLMADNWRSVEAPRYGFCLVTSSAVMTGAMTAVSWFLPANPQRPQVAVTRLDSAVAWAGRFRGAPADALYELEERCRASLAESIRRLKAG